MRIQHLLEHQLSESRAILRESCDGLTQDQRRIVEGIYNEFVPLIEATLTADQIKQIFGSVEKTATAGGSNRTGLGKGIDVAKKADEIVNNVGKWLQDTTPVKMADQKFEQLKAKVGAKFPDLDKQLTGLGSWMKENPGKSAAVIGVLTALASLAGGPLGGAIAGQVLRGAAELIKGEKLSTAVGKGVKTAAYGAIAGYMLDGIGDWLGGLRAEMVPFDKVPGLVKLDVGMSKTITGFGKQLTEKIYAVYVPEDLASTMMAQINAARGGDVDAFKAIWDFSKNFSRKDYLAGMEISNAIAKSIAQENDLFLKGIETANQIITAAAQGSIAGKMAAGDVKVDGKPIVPDGGAPKESYYVQQRPLSEGQVYMILNRVCARNDLLISEGLLKEGPMDFVKNLASKGMDKLRTTGTNLTTKITADKLNSAWQKAGSPTDTEELAKFLSTQGVAKDVVDTVYAELKLPPPPAAPGAAPGEPGPGDKGYYGKGDPEQTKITVAKMSDEKLQSFVDKATDPDNPHVQIAKAELEKRKAGGGAAKPESLYAQIKADVVKLDSKSKKRISAYLQKQLGTV
jgi:hypothetical protein